MKSIVAVLWVLAAVGTLIAHLLGGEVLLGVRFMIGSVLGLQAGLGTGGMYQQGNAVPGVLIGLSVFALGWLILPSTIQMGPGLWVPELCVVIDLSACRTPFRK